MQIDHIAIAVRSIEDAAARLTMLTGYHRTTSPVTNTRQKVNVVFLSKVESIDIKLIEPFGDDSPLWMFLKRGEGLHHVCFRVPDVPEACRALASQGVRILAEPQPGEAFDNNLIAFCYLGLGINAELIDSGVRRNELER